MLQVKIERLVNYYQGQNLSERQIKNRLVKEELKEENEKNQKAIKEITLTINWKKSKMWGYNPNLEGTIKYTDNTFERVEGYKCSGCGYDKESTVISQIFNDKLLYKLWNLSLDENLDRKSLPYGISLNDEFNHYFSGGIGTNEYYKITEFLGGKFENIANGKNFNVYKVTF